MKLILTHDFPHSPPKGLSQHCNVFKFYQCNVFCSPCIGFFFMFQSVGSVLITIQEPKLNFPRLFRCRNFFSLSTH